MKYPPITYNLLVSKEACEGQLKKFLAIFGSVNEADLSEKSAMENGIIFDCKWVAVNLLTKEDSLEYIIDCSVCYLKYLNALEPTYAIFKEKRKEAFTKSQKDADFDIQKVYDETNAEYEKVRIPLSNEYMKNCALIFVRIYTRE